MKLFRDIKKWFDNQEHLFYLFLVIPTRLPALALDIFGVPRHIPDVALGLGVVPRLLYAFGVCPRSRENIYCVRALFESSLVYAVYIGGVLRIMV